MSEKTKMDSGQLYRARAFPDAPPLSENEKWRAVDPRDRDRIRCDRSEMCGDQADWVTRTGGGFSYVCDFHRRVFEATGTFWKDTETVQNPDEGITLYECGICDSLHPWGWDGDCREDANRFADPEEYAERKGIKTEAIRVMSWADRQAADRK